MTRPPDLAFSVVIPAFNEAGNIAPLTAAVRSIMDSLGTWEVIYIDDGSQDDTYARMVEEHARDSRIKLIRFRRNFGQTAAWAAGFAAAQGEVVICLDADLQNDPADIPAMVKKLREEDYDVISGWRQTRRDDLGKRVISWIGNHMRRFTTKEKIHDSGCSLKVYRRECLEGLELYGEMHRYITALLTWKGYHVGELPVRHHPRRSGTTKYNVRRTIKGLLDLLIVKYWMQFSARPIHLFGSIGIVLVGVGMLLGGTLAGLWAFQKISLQGRSTPLLAVLLVVIGFQFIMTGVLADIVAKNYYASKHVYVIRETKGLSPDQRSSTSSA